MTPTRQGSIHLFRLGGIDLYLHWSWFLVALLEIQGRQGRYSSLTWNALEYGSIFLIVLLHEFGHALACRQVGGQANQIVLWPLGGVAYVSPPPRPGPTLWSIAAGPLVNVVLVPALMILRRAAYSWGWDESMPNAYGLLRAIWYINLGLLFFNVLPIYPLDGGQILRALLWFIMGRARSLMVASGLGLVGAAGLVWLAWQEHEVWQEQSAWVVIMAVFMLMNCWSGFTAALGMLRTGRAPRHSNYACPLCGAAPPRGAYWKCGHCGTAFDTFEAQATCPSCGQQFAATACGECGRATPISAWQRTETTGP